MLFHNAKKTLLTLSIAGLLTGTVVAESTAQDLKTRSQQRREKEQQHGKQEVRYPDATRTEPKEKTAPKVAKQEQKLLDTFNDSEFEAAKPLAQALMADANASNYDKALANFIAAQTAYNLDDNEAAKSYAQKAIDLNGLDNNNHFTAMKFLAQLQSQDDQYEEALTTLDRYFNETKSKAAEDFFIRGYTLYRAEKPAEAIPYLKQAIDATPDPKKDWLQVLMRCYMDAEQNDQAVQLAEQLAAKTPNDKDAQRNLFAAYQMADQMDKAAAVMEKLRASGQFTEDSDYRRLYIAYANMDGKEKETIAVISEGLQKGILKPDHQTYVALAQSYYYTDQLPEAIDAWKQGAPLAPNGETYLNLAKVLQSESRLPEAREAARQALVKGIKKPEEAQKIISAK
jgi:tetratricopeptide (TPR) repeat protein